MDQTRHIVAMGGGGFSFGPEWRAVDDFAVGLTGATRPRVCFLPTASGDADSYIARFYDAFPAKRYRSSHLALFDRTVADPGDFLLDQDLIFVGGGNTANMLAVWRLHGVDGALRDAWEAGVVLCGLSAGSLCWFQGGTTDSFGSELTALNDGLGLLSGSHSPHYDGEVQRRPTYHRLVASGALPGGLAADNGVGLHFIGRELSEVVTTHAGRQAYRVELLGRAVTETPLEARLL